MVFVRVRVCLFVCSGGGVVFVSNFPTVHGFWDGWIFGDTLDFSFTPFLFSIRIWIRSAS